jgi:predicted permease
VIAEVAMSVVLLAAAGLMLQSFARMLHAERGFRSQNLVTAELDFSVSGFTTWVEPTATRPQVALKRLMDRLRVLPGVEAMGAGSRLLRRDNQPPQELITIFGRPARDPENQPRVDFKGITPDWVRALGGRMVRGRDFTETDTLHAPGVVLINETFARRFFPDEDPIGQHIRMGTGQPPLTATDHHGIPEWSQIVGIVRDISSLHPRPVVVPEVYASYWQWPMQNPTMLVRTSDDPAKMAESIRRETRTIIPGIPMPRIRTMNELLSDTVSETRLQAGLVTLFAALALLLAAVGLYGVLSYIITHRQREIGIRMALGAPRSNVLWLVMSSGIRLVGIGLLIGMVAALGLTRVLRNLLYSIDPTDPLTLLSVSLMLVIVALLACAWPALRAIRIHPMETLRAE